MKNSSQKGIFSSQTKKQPSSQDIVGSGSQESSRSQEEPDFVKMKKMAELATALRMQRQKQAEARGRVEVGGRVKVGRGWR